MLALMPELPRLSSDSIPLMADVINVVMTVPGLFLLDFVGRRKMLLWGAVLMFSEFTPSGNVQGLYAD